MLIWEDLNKILYQIRKNIKKILNEKGRSFSLIFFCYQIKIQVKNKEERN